MLKKIWIQSIINLHLHLQDIPTFLPLKVQRRTNVKPPFPSHLLFSGELEALFEAFDDSDDADKNPDNNAVIKAIAQESGNFVPRQNSKHLVYDVEIDKKCPEESKELNGKVYNKEHSTDGSPGRASSSEKLSKPRVSHFIREKIVSLWIIRQEDW